MKALVEKLKSYTRPALALAVALLLAAGADPLFETDLGLTALDMASSVECLDLMRAAIRGKRALQR